MASIGQWIQGARPKTLPAAVAPVAVGTGAAIEADGAVWWKALLALVVSLALQVGVNYANDYSDGIKGTDEVRVGPLRLVGSKLASPASVRNAAFGSFAVAAVVGLVLAATSSWWLLVVGAAAIAAAWGYTGGAVPYGYRALGEVSVFVFFGLVATVGTTYVQVEDFTTLSVLASIPVGMLACALLVVNNLRDAPQDAKVGKRTLAVLLGDGGTRNLFAALLLGPFVVALALIPMHPAAALALLSLPMAAAPVRAVRNGAVGRDLIPVLVGTGRAQLGYGLLLAGALALSF
ncbi:MAG: 1,4-dihydroxy-2-naphthoate polyprenyltransferase [Sporichthyaceae bacterium]